MTEGHIHRHHHIVAVPHSQNDVIKIKKHFLVVYAIFYVQTDEAGDDRKHLNPSPMNLSLSRPTKKCSYIKLSSSTLETSTTTAVRLCRNLRCITMRPGECESGD